MENSRSERLESDTEVALFFLIGSNIGFALFHTTYLCWLLFEYTCVSSSLRRYARVVWGGDIKIGRGSVGVRACLFWCVQLSTLYGKNSLLHL